MQTPLRHGLTSTVELARKIRTGLVRSFSRSCPFSGAGFSSGRPGRRGRTKGPLTRWAPCHPGARVTVRSLSPTLFCITEAFLPCVAVVRFVAPTSATCVSPPPAFFFVLLHAFFAAISCDLLRCQHHRKLIYLPPYGSWDEPVTDRLCSSAPPEAASSSSSLSPTSRELEPPVPHGHLFLDAEPPPTLCGGCPYQGKSGVGI